MNPYRYGYGGSQFFEGMHINPAFVIERFKQLMTQLPKKVIDMGVGGIKNPLSIEDIRAILQANKVPRERIDRFILEFRNKETGDLKMIARDKLARKTEEKVMQRYEHVMRPILLEERRQEAERAAKEAEEKSLHMDEKTKQELLEVAEKQREEAQDLVEAELEAQRDANIGELEAEAIEDALAAEEEEEDRAEEERKAKEFEDMVAEAARVSEQEEREYKGSKIVHEKAKRLRTILANVYNIKAKNAIPEKLLTEFLEAPADVEDIVIDKYKPQLQHLKVINDEADALGKKSKALGDAKILKRLAKLANKRMKLKKSVETIAHEPIAPTKQMEKTLEENPRGKVKLAGPGRGKKCGRGGKSATNIGKIKIIY